MKFSMTEGQRSRPQRLVVYGSEGILLATLSNIPFNLMAYIVFPIILLLLSTASLVGDSYNPFIYFQF